jgi:hypothetical protein
VDEGIKLLRAEFDGHDGAEAALFDEGLNQFGESLHRA